MKRIVSLLIALIVSHLSLKVYLYYQISSEVDSFIAQMDPFAKVEYKGISTSFLNQSFSVNHIEVSLAQSVSPIHIEKISIFGAKLFNQKDSWFKTLDFSQESYQGLMVQNLSFDINELIPYENLYKTNKVDSFNPTTLKKLGYNRINTDIALTLRTYPETKNIEILYEQSYEKMFEFGLEATVAASQYSTETLNPRSAYRDFQLINASALYKDNSFLNKFFTAQAASLGVSLSDYKESILESIKTQLKTNKLDLSPAQAMVIENLVNNHKAVKISITPSNPLGIQAISHLHLYQPNDVAKMLNLELSNQD